MLGFTSEHWVILSIATVAVCGAVLIHYETLSLLSIGLGRARLRSRSHVLVMMFGILAAHIVEIWLFGGVYFLALKHPVLGSLGTGAGVDLPECIYYSSVVYTTLGFGDITPHGPIRLLSGSEALCGFVLITWSASFTFLQMQRFWRDR